MKNWVDLKRKHMKPKKKKWIREQMKRKKIREKARTLLSWIAQVDQRWSFSVSGYKAMGKRRGQAKRILNKEVALQPPQRSICWGPVRWEDEVDAVCVAWMERGDSV